MTWRGELELDYRLEDGRTAARDRHHGPLRVLKALYPDSPLECQHVLVHPPGGLAGGDELHVRLQQAQGTRVVVTTPGATRYYRSLGASALQSVELHLQAGARLQWLPLETIAHGGCRGINRLRMVLAPGAQVLGWDLLSLGLPAGDDAFAQGSFEQHLELQGAWLERGRLDAHDHRLLQSPLGLAGRRLVGALWFADGAALSEALRQALVDEAQTVVQALVTAGTAGTTGAGDGRPSLQIGATSPCSQVVVVRVLADRVEPAAQALRAIRRAWVRRVWAEEAGEPRIWRL